MGKSLQAPFSNYPGTAISGEMATSIGKSIGNDIIVENKVVVISR